MCWLNILYGTFVSAKFIIIQEGERVYVASDKGVGTGNNSDSDITVSCNSEWYGLCNSVRLCQKFRFIRM